MRRHLPLAVLAALVALAGFAVPARADDVPKLAFEKYVLPNGLEVILHPDPSIPLVAVDVWYHVGSGDETPGKSGFAHLFEHMLFQGSQHVGEDQHFEVLKNIGSSDVNGSTNTDRTNYYEVVPSNQLEAALWLESDRMGYLLPLLGQKSLANQIDVVRNERRQRYDNVPYGKALFALSALLYPEGHPYRYLTIGKHEDLEGANLDDVRGFYRTWYAPGNATLVIAGDFEPARGKELVQKWFGTFPKTGKPTQAKVAAPTVAHQRRTIEDGLAQLRRIEYAWHSPALFAPGDAELDVVANALGDPRTGRLYKALVLDAPLAQTVNVFQASRQQSSYFVIQVLARTGADLAAIDKIVDAELARLRRDPLTKAELDRTVIQIEAGMIWGLEDLLARAESLQRCNHYTGKPDCLGEELARYRALTTGEVLATIQRTLAPERRVDLVTMPAAKPAKDAP
jgi:predicted Zn-dependent peptidase